MTDQVGVLLQISRLPWPRVTCAVCKIFGVRAALGRRAIVGCPHWAGAARSSQCNKSMAPMQLVCGNAAPIQSACIGCRLECFCGNGCLARHTIWCLRRVSPRESRPANSVCASSTGRMARWWLGYSHCSACLDVGRFMEAPGCSSAVARSQQPGRGWEKLHDRGRVSPRLVCGRADAGWIGKPCTPQRV